MNFRGDPGLTYQMKAGVITLDCASAPVAELGTVELIALIRLCTKECGEEVRLVNVSRGLRDLIELCGLGEVLGVEVERHPEKRE